MSMQSWERNTTGLQAHAQRRKQATLARVEQALATLLGPENRDDNGGRKVLINFNTVAKEAGVTKAYLYHDDLMRGRIEALREQEQQTAVRRRLRPQGKTDAGKDVIILAKDRRIKELEAEVKRLNREVQVARGQLYDRM